MKGENVNRKRVTITVDKAVAAALHRLSKVSGTPISRLVEEFIREDVLDSISNSIEAARSGRPLEESLEPITRVIGRHVLATSDLYRNPVK